jgi:hypothetical protein
LKPRFPFGIVESDLRCIHLPRVPDLAVHDRPLAFLKGSLDISCLDQLGFAYAEGGADRAEFGEGKGG